MENKIDINVVRMPLNAIQPKSETRFNSYKRLEKSLKTEPLYNALCKVCDKIYLTSNCTPNRRDCPHCKLKSTSVHVNHRSTRPKDDCKRFQCNVCDKQFRQKGQLKSHVYIHNDEYPLKCRFCGKGFRQKGNLKFHELSHANGGESFPCKYCGKNFNHPGNRYTHEFLHTGKRFKCDKCSQFFQQLNSLKRHKCSKLK